MSQLNTLSFELKRNLRDLDEVPENLPTLRAMYKACAKAIPPTLEEKFATAGFVEGFDAIVKSVKDKTCEPKNAFESAKTALLVWMQGAQELLSHLTEDDFKKRSRRGSGAGKQGKVTTFALFGSEPMGTLEHAVRLLEGSELATLLANGYGDVTDTDKANLVKITNAIADAVKKSIPDDWRNKRQRKPKEATATAPATTAKGK